MKKYLLATLATFSLAHVTADVQHNPWIPDVSNFLTGIFTPYSFCGSPYIVVGGSGNYSTSSYPQYALYDLFEAVNLDPIDFGSTEGLVTNNESSQNYFWGAYGGIHQPIDKNWNIGFEIGFKKVISTNSTTNILFTTVPITAFLETPFRTVNNDVWDLLFVVKYQSQMGLNLFVKAGGAKVRTVISEGNFINPLDNTLNGVNTFGVRSYTLTNVYPEIEIGAGYRVLNHFEVHLSYAKIIAPTENDYVSPTAIFFRPRKCPSIDIFTISVEMLIF